MLSETSETGPREEAIKIAIAGGGTGGHVFPGIAVLKALKRICQVEAIWIGTGREVEKKALGVEELQYRELRVMPFYGAGVGGAIKAISRLPIATFKARRVLNRFRPSLVLGIGGYVAGPVILAAKTLGIPSVIHEQNLIPGLSNRLASRLVSRIFISFKGTRAWFPSTKTVLTGNPVRQEFLEVSNKEESDDMSRPKRILIIGGSQGARAINRLTTSALTILVKSGIDLEILHQAGDKDLEYTRKVYQKASLKATVHGFIYDMPKAYGWADLVIARAGAGTCAELAVTGRPSILIPYPHAASGHQEANAMEFKDAGASITFRENEVGPERLASSILSILNDPEGLCSMRKNARRLAKPKAADTVAKEILKLIRGKDV